MSWEKPPANAGDESAKGVLFPPQAESVDPPVGKL